MRQNGDDQFREDCLPQTVTPINLRRRHDIRICFVCHAARGAPYQQHPPLNATRCSRGIL